MRAIGKYLVAVAVAGLPVVSVAAQDLAVRAARLYSMSGPPLENAVVLVEKGKIRQVGPATSVAVPTGVKVLEAAVVTPGLIDAHTVVGLSGYLNQLHDQDQIEKSSPTHSELRAVDAYNARERLVEWVRGFGTTTLHTGHAPGSLISGQTMIVKSRGNTVDEALIQPVAMVAATLGPSAYAASGKAPGTRAKEMAMLRAELIKAQEYRTKRKLPEDKRPSRDLHLETLSRILDRELPLLLTAHRAQDIMSALRLAKEFDIRVVLDGAAESYLVADQIREAGVPVILHPTMARSNQEAENLSFETAAVLKRKGIPVALQSGFEAYVPKTRVVLFEAALAAANGLTTEEALATITIDAAKVLGVEKRLGSIERGKDADLVLFDGDPFEYTSHVIGVVIDGVVVSSERR